MASTPTALWAKYRPGMVIAIVRCVPSRIATVVRLAHPQVCVLTIRTSALVAAPYVRIRGCGELRCKRAMTRRVAGSSALAISVPLGVTHRPNAV